MKGMVSPGHWTPVTPLARTRHIFTSPSTRSFTTGNTYTVIGSGKHWHKDYGFGIWLTNDDYPENPKLDEDFGVFVSVGYFNKHFFAH